jgi:hypothetical protein
MTLPTILRCHGNVFTELLPSNDKGKTNKPTDSPLTRHGPHRKLRVQQFLYCCVYSLQRERVYRAVV